MPVDPNDTFIGGYAPYVRLQQEIENGKLHNQMLQQALQLAPQELQMRQQQLSQQKQMGDAQIAQIYGMLPAHQAMAMSSVNEANAKIADLKQTTEMAKQLQAGLLDSQKYKLQQEKALADTATQTADLRLKLGEEELKRSGISGNTEATRNMLLNQQIPTIIAQSKADLNKTLATTDELHTQTKSLQQQVELSGVQKEMALMQEMRQWPAEMRKQVITAHADETTPLFNILKDKPELLEDDKFLPYTQMIEGKMMKDPVIGPQLMAAEFEKKFGVPLPNQPQVVSPSMPNPGENFRKALNDATTKFYKAFPAPAPGQKQPVQQQTMPAAQQGTMPQQQTQPAPTPSGTVQQGASNDTSVTPQGADALTNETFQTLQANAQHLAKPEYNVKDDGARFGSAYRNADYPVDDERWTTAFGGTADKGMISKLPLYANSPFKVAPEDRAKYADVEQKHINNDALETARERSTPRQRAVLETVVAALRKAAATGQDPTPMLRQLRSSPQLELLTDQQRVAINEILKQNGWTSTGGK